LYKDGVYFGSGSRGEKSRRGKGKEKSVVDRGVEQAKGQSICNLSRSKQKNRGKEERKDGKALYGAIEGR